MMLTQANFLNPLDDHHIVADGRLALSLEHRREAIGFHPRAFRHLHQGFRSPQRRLTHALRLNIRADFLENRCIVLRDLIDVRILHIGDSRKPASDAGLRSVPQHA